MNPNPFFSIVIPTYNREGFIKKTIESVLVQTFQDFEIVVIDDGSTDDTEKVVKSIVSDKVFYHKKENAERGAARNYGARIAKGQFINFLDSDDVLYPQHLKVAADFIGEHHTVEIFHLGYDLKDEFGVVLRQVGNIQSINREILSGNILSCNGVFIRKKCLLENPFNEDRALASLEDWELWIRMSARYAFLHNNTITSSVVQHDARSVMVANKLKIKQKADLFVQSVLSDEGNQRQFGTKIKKAVASAWTYTALHLLMAKEHKFVVWQYLWRGVRTYPGEIMKKRFFVIVKGLLAA